MDYIFNLKSGKMPIFNVFCQMLKLAENLFNKNVIPLLLKKNVSNW